MLLTAASNQFDKTNLEFHLNKTTAEANRLVAISLAYSHNKFHGIENQSFNSHWNSYLAELGSAEHQYLKALDYRNNNQQEAFIVWLNQAAHNKHAKAMQLMLESDSNKEHWLQQLALIDSTLLFETAENWVIEGRYSLAKEALEILAQQRHPSSNQALTQLNRYFLQQNQETIGAENCLMPIVFYAADLTSASRAEQLLKTYQADQQMQSLAICFRITAATHAPVDCNNDFDKRDCVDNKDTFSVIFTDNDKAYVQGSRMYLSDTHNYDVFKHELFHFAGFVDEYPLNKRLAAQFCNLKTTIPNLMVTAKNAQPPIIEKHPYLGKLGRSDIHLTKTNTCNNTDLQAWKFVAETTFMEYQELPVSEVYIELFKSVLAEKSIN